MKIQGNYVPPCFSSLLNFVRGVIINFFPWVTQTTPREVRLVHQVLFRVILSTTKEESYEGEKTTYYYLKSVRETLGGIRYVFNSIMNDRLLRKQSIVLHKRITKNSLSLRVSFKLSPLKKSGIKRLLLVLFEARLYPSYSI